MYTVQNISVLELRLDEKNPRFILPDIGENQANIRKYLLEQEDALDLAKEIVDYGGLMPGERIVVTKEDNQYVVLEGNRRVCVCQMLVDRSLIPEEFINSIPVSSSQTNSSLLNVDVDILPSREEARRFLATRHIERAREWSTIAKMRFCFEDFDHGKTVQQIKDRTGLSTANINKYLKNYKILIRGLEGNWSYDEKKKLFILDIEPDRLIRIFDLKDTKRILQLYIDSQENLQSNLISKADLDEIIHIWTRKAFIDKEMDTRTSFGNFDKNGNSTGACRFIEHILLKYYRGEKENSTTDDGSSTTSAGSNEKCNSENSGGNTNDRSTTNQNTNANNEFPKKGGATTGKSTDGSASDENTATNGGPKLSPFFGGLNWNNVKETESNGKGVIAVCKELVKISGSTNFVNAYPICTAFIIRALIEQSLKYYANKKGYWALIMKAYHIDNNNKNNGDPQLSFIIKEYKKNEKVWIPEQHIRRLFDVIFTQNVQIEKFNLVVHSPECYTLSPSTLKSIPGEGLLALVNFLLL